MPNYSHAIAAITYSANNHTHSDQHAVHALTNRYRPICPITYSGAGCHRCPIKEKICLVLHYLAFLPGKIWVACIPFSIYLCIWLGTCIQFAFYRIVHLYSISRVQVNKHAAVNKYFVLNVWVGSEYMFHCFINS